MTKNARLAVGVGVAVVVVLGLLVLLRPNGFAGGGGGPTAGDDSRTLTLEKNGSGNCVITTNSADKNVHVTKNHKVTWTVDNKCDTPQVVVIGNLRPYNTSNSVTDCNAGKVESVWPFKNEDQSLKYIYAGATSKGETTLKEAKNDTGNQVKYSFDVCMGGTKIDPELVIDP